MGQPAEFLASNDASPEAARRQSPRPSQGGMPFHLVAPFMTVMAAVMVAINIIEYGVGE